MEREGRQDKYTQNIDSDLDQCIPPVGIIRDYMDWAHKTTHAPPIYHLASILPCLAYEATRMDFRLRLEGANHKSNKKMHLWTAIVGSSSTGKSTATKNARKFFADYGTKRQGSRFRLPFLHLEGSMQGVIHRLTTEEWYDKDSEQTPCILYLDEFSRIVWQESGATGLCLLYDGETFDRSLRSLQQEDEEAVVKNPTISACFAGTQASLERYVTAEHVEGGLFARILWFTGEVSPDKLMFEEQFFPKERDSALKSWDDWGREMAGHVAMGKSKNVVLDHHSLELIEDMLFEPFRETFAQNDRANSLRMRMLSHVRTIAGLYALSRGTVDVHHDDMLRAINLAATCLEFGSVVSNVLGVPEQISARNKLLSHIKECGDRGCTVSRLLRYAPARLRRKDDLQEALDFLVAAEYITPIASQGGHVGRPTVQYVACEFAKNLKSDPGTKH